MCRPSKECVKSLSHDPNLFSGYRNGSIYISNLLNTNLDLIMQQRNIVNSYGFLINSS